MSAKIPWNLLVSKLRQTISESEEAEFQKWLKTGDNKQLFRQLEIVWYNVQKKVETYEPDLDYYWKELRSRMDDVDLNNRIIFKPEPVTKPSGLKKILQVAAAVAAVIIATTGIIYFAGNGSENDTPTQTYSAITGKSRIMLPDGSEVWLNANSTLSYFKNPDSRSVELSGEAYFHVKPDAKPFLVTAGDVTVKVHGTQFNVNSYLRSENIVVSLFEGSVSLSKYEDKEVFYLKPGEEGLYSKQNQSITIEEGDVEFAKVWTQDRIRFENKSLREITRYLAKWYGVDIQVDKRVPDGQSFTFTLKDQSLDEMVRIMAGLEAIDYYFVNNNTLIITSKN